MPVGIGVGPDVRAGRDARYPAGPAFLPRLLQGRLFRAAATDSMIEASREFGDLVSYSVFGRRIYQINHPALIEDFILKDAGKHHRGLVMQRARTILGNGMLTAEDPGHIRQRRLAQPAFHRERIAAYGETIGVEAVRMSSSWTPGAGNQMHEAMLELALRIVGKCLFNLDVASRDEVMRISQAVDAFMGFLPLALLPFSAQIQRLPLPMMKRIRTGQRELDELIFGMIRERREQPGDRGDLLSMLLASADPEDPEYMLSDRQIRDECITILLAGHETTANALSFALWMLAKHPEVQERLREEARGVFAGRVPVAGDYPRLPYAKQVFSEVLRLYPPVWVTARTCVEPYEIAGFAISKGAILLASQFVVHRDARWFSEPMKFDPERWAGANSRPKFSFFPFIAGGRQCIGEGLAWMEGVLALATFARDWRMAPAAGAPEEIAVDASISLRPKGGLPISLKRN